MLEINLKDGSSSVDEIQIPLAETENLRIDNSKGKKRKRDKRTTTTTNTVSQNTSETIAVCSHTMEALRFSTMLNPELLSILKTTILGSKAATQTTEDERVKKIFELFKSQDPTNFFDFVTKKIMKQEDLDWITNDFVDNERHSKQSPDHSPNGKQGTKRKRKQQLQPQPEHPKKEQVVLDEELSRHSDIVDLYSSPISKFVKNCDDRIFVKSVTTAIKKLITIRSKECHFCKTVLECLDHTFLDVSSGKIDRTQLPMASDKNYFVFLMIHMVSGKKNETSIGISTSPMLAILLLNMGVLEGSKAIKSVAPWWMPEVVIGKPLDESDTLKLPDACDTLEDCYNETRGIMSKRDKMRLVAKQRGLVCWDKRILPSDSSHEDVENGRYLFTY